MQMIKIYALCTLFIALSTATRHVSDDWEERDDTPYVEALEVEGNQQYAAGEYAEPFDAKVNKFFAFQSDNSQREGVRWVSSGNMLNRLGRDNSKRGSLKDMKAICDKMNANMLEEDNCGAVVCWKNMPVTTRGENCRAIQGKKKTVATLTMEYTSSAGLISNHKDIATIYSKVYVKGAPWTGAVYKKTASAL